MRATDGWSVEVDRADRALARVTTPRVPRHASRDPADLSAAWQRALSADRPCILDIHCDPDVPPIPPHATLEQMTDMAKALIQGDTSRWGVIKEGLKTKAQEILPGR